MKIEHKKFMRYENFVDKLIAQKYIEVQQGESINTIHVLPEGIEEIGDKRISGLSKDYTEVPCLKISGKVIDEYLNLYLGKSIFLLDGDAFECHITQLSHAGKFRVKDEIIFTSDLIRYIGKIAVQETVNRFELLDL